MHRDRKKRSRSVDNEEGLGGRGVGTNVRPLESTEICAGVSCVCERLTICFCRCVLDCCFFCSK